MIALQRSTSAGASSNQSSAIFRGGGGGGAARGDRDRSRYRRRTAPARAAGNGGGLGAARRDGWIFEKGEKLRPAARARQLLSPAPCCSACRRAARACS